MSKQERIIKLTYGYIRNNCKYQIPSDILYQLVLQFIGDVNNFDGRQLMTDKEIRDEQQKCLDFITDTFCFRRYSGWSDVFCKLGSEIFCLILFISVFIGKDIACIIINDQNQCNHNIDGSNKYVSFDLNTWIAYGCITHIIVSILFLCIAITCVVSANDRGCPYDYFDDLFEGGVTGVTFICIIFPWCFFVSWMVIGFLLHSEMSNDDKQCKNVVLSWCILQAIETVATPLMVFVWWFCMACLTYED